MQRRCVPSFISDIKPSLYGNNHKLVEILKFMAFGGIGENK